MAWWRGDKDRVCPPHSRLAWVSGSAVQSASQSEPNKSAWWGKARRRGFIGDMIDGGDVDDIEVEVDSGDDTSVTLLRI